MFNSFTGNTNNIYLDTFEPTGFINIDKILVFYDHTGRTITLTATTGNIEYYWRGKKYNLGNTWKSQPHTDDTSSWYLYTTNGSDFNWSNTAWKFYEMQIAARPANTTWALSEVHGIMPYSVHKELHQTIGTYRVSGFGLENGTYSLQPLSPTDSDNRPHFYSGVIADEDLETTIDAWNESQYTVLFFSGSGTPNFVTGNTDLFRLGSTYPTINTWNGSTFTDVEMLNDHYANLYIIRIPVTKDTHSQKYRAVILQPQYQYSTIIAAQGENIQTIELSTLKDVFAEFVLVERITIRTDSTYTNAVGRTRIEAVGVLELPRYNQGSFGIGSVAAGNITVVPSLSYQSTNLQDLSDEYAVAIDSRITNSEFSTFTGTTLPSNYFTKTLITGYTAQTYVMLENKAYLSGATFTGVLRVPKPLQNDNTTCVATTSWYISQGGTANPLMNGSVAIGTSNLFSRQDHIHPSDTTKVDISGDIMTGSLGINVNLNVTGVTKLCGAVCLPNLTTGNTSTDYNLVINPTTNEIKKIRYTGGSDQYFYTEKTTLSTLNAGSAVYLSGTPWNFNGGRYQINFDAQFGNNNAAGVTCVWFSVDGVTIGVPYNNGGLVTNWVSSASLSRDVTLSSGCHCLVISYARGANTACMTYGMIRVKRL